VLTVSATDLGTPEPTWLAWPALRDAPPLTLGRALGPAGRLVVVAPHPDDEVLAAAGLMHHAAAEGHTVEIVAVTDGEASHPGLPGDRTRLAARRRRETTAALACLGLDPVVHHLGRPDGRVADDEASLAEHLSDVLDHTTTCVSPWRHDGHPDHEATGRAALTACRRTGATLVEYPVWAWHWATPPTGMPASQLRRLDLPPAVRAAKKDAIDRFHTQTRPLDEAPTDPVVLPPAVLARFLRGFETFLIRDEHP